MKFAYFTHWNLPHNKIKANPKLAGNYTPDDMMPFILDADIFNFTLPILEKDLEEYDWVIMNNDKHFYDNKAMVEQFLNYFTSYNLKSNHLPTKLCILQEGPIFDWQTWTMERQWTYRKLMKLADLFICNNKEHIDYYLEYCRKVAIYRVPLILSDYVQRKLKEKSDSIIINGDFTDWYNGNTSLDIAKAAEGYNIAFPSMGRSQENELNYLPLLIPSGKFVKVPFVKWDVWADIISQCKFGINMMTAIACGTFSVLCAACGVLCIGNEEFDTQRYLFPNLSIKSYEIKKGKELLKRLIEDEAFRKEQEKIMNERIKDYDIEVIKKELMEAFK